jgi:hypothetical protein
MGVIYGDILESLAASDLLHSGSGLELRAMGAAFTHGRETLLSGGAPPQGYQWVLSRKPDHLRVYGLNYDD